MTVRPSNFAEWAEGNGLPIDGSGLGDPYASAMGDGVSNLEKYALGLLATDLSQWQVEQDWYDDPQSGERYAAIWLRALKGLPDIQVGAEESIHLGTWAGTAVDTGNLLQHGDGTESRQFRHSLPISDSPNCFLRASLRYASEN